MENTSWLDYITALGAIATPLLVLALTAVGWRIRTRLERRLDLENRLREDRIKVYNDILEPLIILFTSDAAWQSDRKNKDRNKNDVAMEKMLSLEYRQQAFRMSLVGSDSVVRAYNNFLQFFYNRDGSGGPQSNDLVAMLSLVGSFLLEIRKSMGNEATELDNWEMLEWFITDARKHRPKPGMQF